MTTQNTQLAVIDVNELVPVEHSKRELFFLNENGEVDGIINALTNHYSSIVLLDPLGETEAGRKQIKNLAAQLNKDIKIVDDIGKNVVAELKAKPKLIDASRKKLRDTLGEVYANIRKPVTDYESEQARIKAEEEEAERKRIEVIEAENARLRAEAEQKARDERISKEAEARAKLEAEAELIKQKQELQRQKDELQKKEQQRIDKEKAEQEAEANRLADVQHKRKVKNKAYQDLINFGIDKQVAVDVIKLIDEGKVSNIKINY